jgi:hypothetical protein
LKRHGRTWRHCTLDNAPTENLPRLKYGVTHRYHGIECRLRADPDTLKCRSSHGFRLYGEAGYDTF